MKKRTVIISSWVVGCIVVGAASLRAQPSFPAFLTTEALSVTLTAMIQTDSGVDISHGNTTGTKDTTMKLKVTNKDFLNLIGAPTGAKLVLMNNGGTLGWRKGTNDPTDSGIYSGIQSAGNVTLDKGLQTETSTATDTSSRTVSKSNYTGSYIATVAVDTSSLSSTNAVAFQITGLATETQTDSQTDVENDSGSTTRTSSSHSFSVSAAGEGTVAGASALLSGTVSSKGSESSSE
jgi:hypothetical protein